MHGSNVDCMQILVETAGGDKYKASDALKMLQDLNLTQQVIMSIGP